MSIDYFAILPQMILVLAGMVILLLEPLTPPAKKGQLGQIAVIAAFLAACTLSFQHSEDAACHLQRHVSGRQFQLYVPVAVFRHHRRQRLDLDSTSTRESPSTGANITPCCFLRAPACR